MIIKLSDKNTLKEVGKLDENGFLRAPARFARTGIQPYMANELDPNSFPDRPEPYLIYRPEGEVFDPESMKSLEGMDVTADAHEWQLPEKEGAVIVGSVSGPVRREGDYLVGEILFKRKEAIDRVRARDLVEISAGYNSSTSAGQGQYSGRQYDGVTRNIRYNHLTVLPPGKGRAGPEVRITDKKEEPMELITIATKHGDIQVPPTSRQVVQRLMDQAAEAEEEKKKKDQKCEELEDENEELKKEKEENEKKMDSMSADLKKAMGELDSTKQALTDALSGESLQKAAAELAETQANCRQIMGDAYPADNKLTAKKLKLEAARHHATSKGMVIDSNTDEQYLLGIYNAALFASPAQQVKTPKVPPMMDAVGIAGSYQNSLNRLSGKGGK